jgi:hypothetical protein
MANFVKGSELNHEIDSLFENATIQLTIVSPFIKLHSRQKDALRTKLDNPNFNIKLVFGKNESNKSKSLGLDDFDFFKQFANIKIYYEPRLHAKYYANENKGILSSMNLYEYSQNHNIEFGVVTHRESGIEKLKEKVMGIELDNDAWQYFNSVVDGSSLMYHNDPVFESTMLGLSKKYIRSEVRIDLLTAELSKSKKVQSPKATTIIDIKQNKSSVLTKTGYCIRTGDEIPFDITKPYTDKAFKSWNSFKNKDFPEKYCHYSGDSADGKTSMAKPILSKNWSKAKKDLNFK